MICHFGELEKIGKHKTLRILLVEKSASNIYVVLPSSMFNPNHRVGKSIRAHF